MAKSPWTKQLLKDVLFFTALFGIGVASYLGLLSTQRALLALGALLCFTVVPRYLFAALFLLLRELGRLVYSLLHPLSGWRLRLRFGSKNVVRALNLRLVPTDRLIDGPLKFGGIPDFEGLERWPRCSVCTEPMTFIGQIPVGPGPDRPLRHPYNGVLYLFLCNTSNRAGAHCWRLGREAGTSAAFVQPGWRGQAPLGEGEAEKAALARLIAENHGKADDDLSFEGLERQGREREYLPYLTRQYAVRYELLPSVRMPEHCSDEDINLVVKVTDRFHIQVGGFPEWMYPDPVSFPCTCGAPTELLLNFASFDPGIEPGREYGGRMYVFACQRRHGPEAYFFDWQAD